MKNTHPSNYAHGIVGICIFAAKTSEYKTSNGQKLMMSWHVIKLHKMTLNYYQSPTIRGNVVVVSVVAAVVVGCAVDGIGIVDK